MCCHTEMPCRRHRTQHPTPSQYTDTGPTCRCAIHRCGTSHWNTQLPIFMSWVRPDREILPRPSTHTSERSTWCCNGGQQSEAKRYECSCMKNNFLKCYQGCHWLGKSQGNSRSGKSQGILELVREIWNFVLKSGKFMKSQGNFKKIYVS